MKQSLCLAHLIKYVTFSAEAKILVSDNRNKCLIEWGMELGATSQVTLQYLWRLKDVGLVEQRGNLKDWLGWLKPRSSSSRLRDDSLTPLHAPNQASVLNCHVAPRVQRPSPSKRSARSLGFWRPVLSPQSMRHLFRLSDTEFFASVLKVTYLFKFAKHKLCFISKRHPPVTRVCRLDASCCETSGRLMRTYESSTSFLRCPNVVEKTSGISVRCGSTRYKASKTSRACTLISELDMGSPTAAENNSLAKRRCSSPAPFSNPSYLPNKRHGLISRQQQQQQQLARKLSAKSSQLIVKATS
ncbi:hypothetical protein PsorP6_011557 [Peronosclerospora sorghi]|uniref:Uncharacterized protein n=1 Tax=Peronosclerospora sorghi TaxID=230839 RepID=A0ACC0WJR6_9STRA|nr:hypothetical protein PsorP6_011557 [Peronosclerospora sorghi]